MCEFDHWLKKFTSEFKKEIETENIHKEYYQDDDESIEAEQWRFERKGIETWICDDIKKEMLKVKELRRNTKFIVRVIIQAEKEAKRILESYRKDLDSKSLCESKFEIKASLNESEIKMENESEIEIGKKDS